MVKQPPFGMASLAFVARLINTCSIWLLSAITIQSLSVSTALSFISSLTSRVKRSFTPFTMSFMFTGFGLLGCFLLKTRSPLVNCAALSADLIIFCVKSLVLLSSFISQSSKFPYPIIAVRILLKSCATPPASVPIESIFWA